MEDLKEKYLKKIDDISSKAKQDIEEAIKAYEEELNSQDGGHWIPAEEERYWCMDSNGWAFHSTWEDYPCDNSRLEIGNAFKTEKEAEFEVERLKILAIMKKYSKPFEQYGNNYCIVFDQEEDSVEIKIFSMWDTGIYYFESEEMALKVIDEIGGYRLKKYYFRLE